MNNTTSWLRHNNSGLSWNIFGSRAFLWHFDMPQYNMGHEIKMRDGWISIPVPQFLGCIVHSGRLPGQPPVLSDYCVKMSVVIAYLADCTAVICPYKPIVDLCFVFLLLSYYKTSDLCFIKLGWIFFLPSVDCNLQRNRFIQTQIMIQYRLNNRLNITTVVG